MTTKAKGPLMADYRRMLKAAEKEGWNEVTLKSADGTEVTFRKGEKGGTPAAPRSLWGPPSKDKPKPKLVW